MSSIPSYSRSTGVNQAYPRAATTSSNQPLLVPAIITSMPAHADRASVAAAYLVGLTMNDGHIDGNKRVGFASAATLLRLNGVRLTAPEVEAYEIVIGVTERRITEEQIADWIRSNLVKI